MRTLKACLVAVLFFGAVAAGRAAPAREEWFRGLDLEDAVARADLILVARVGEVSEAKMVSGGKVERELRQYRFDPQRTLKGVFTRDALQLTTEDLGSFSDSALPQRGQIRLLFLGRSQQGYANANQRGSLDQSLPPLADEADPLLAAVKVLIGVTQQHDRGKKVSLLLEGLREARGPAAVPLLASLQRRALLAAQNEGTGEALAKHLGDASPAVSGATARTLDLVLEADYLEHKALRESAVTALAAALNRADADLGGRVAALDALGAAGPPALANQAAAQLLKVEPLRDTFAERSALLRDVGRLKVAAQRDAVRAQLEQLPLDAPADARHDAAVALIRLDPEQAGGVLVKRLQKAYAAGLDLQAEVTLLGELPPAAAVPALLDVIKLPLTAAEKIAFARAAQKLADPRLVPPLADMLDPRNPGMSWHAVEALLKIGSAEAAKVLQPHLREEADLMRKLRIAELLGRHGMRDGYPYAMEHLSEPGLMERAIAALAAIKEPKAVGVLRDILKSSNDTAWNSVAIRALGALGDKEVTAQCLEIVQDFKNSLAPAALIALGDLGEAKALPRLKDALGSRNERIVLAGVRAAGKLLARPDVKADDLRDQLASLAADADAEQGLRLAALDALVTLQDPRLDRVLAATVRDAELESGPLLARSEELLRQRKVKLP